MLEVNRLYPQYVIMQERRQQNAPVNVERRSGIDRRSNDRVKLDTTLTRDIFEVKNKVAQVQKVPQKEAEKVTFTQNAPKAALHAINSDQFIKSTKTNSMDNAVGSSKIVAKSKSQAGALAGLLGVVLGGTLASAFLGVAGVGLAIGLGAYFGGKLLRGAIVSHLKNK